jgi:UDP-glucose 4-epimerase
LIPCALRSLINSTPIEIFGTDFPTLDGTAVRDYIHIHDLAEAHILSLEKMIRKDKSAFYNLGTGSGFSVRQVLAAIETVTKKKLLIKETKKRPGDPPILIADNTLAMQQLQWRPQYTDIKTIIRHAWEALPIFAA